MIDQKISLPERPLREDFVIPVLGGVFDPEPLALSSLSLSQLQISLIQRAWPSTILTPQEMRGLTSLQVGQGFIGPTLNFVSMPDSVLPPSLHRY